jgi:phosphoserine phosphatase
LREVQRRRNLDDAEAIRLSHVMTLIAGPGVAPALPGLLARLVEALPLADAPAWLAPGIACDLALGDIAPQAAEAVARNVIGDLPIDVLIQKAESRRKRILVADFEATIIENEMLDELADFIGRRSEVAEITRRAMNGELDFAAALSERVAMLKGLPASILDEAAGRIRVTPGARALVATASAAGMRTALVSGGFTVFAEGVAKQLGFERIIANRLDIADGRIAGTVAAPIVTSSTKREALLALAAEAGADAEATLAVGDGANDLPMLACAGLGISFHAKPSVAAAARWRIDHADLSALLYAQGYRAEEIVGR